MNFWNTASKSPRNEAKPLSPLRHSRLRNVGLLFGGLILVLVAILIVQAVRSATNDKDAILHNALDQGFWIARSLEIGHGLLLAEQKDAMRDMVKEITRHGAVESLLIVDEDRRVLVASNPAQEGSVLPEVFGEPMEHGSVLRGDSQTTEVVFPAFFVEASRRMGNLHPQRDRSIDRAKWVIVILDTSKAYAHYRSSLTQSILVLLVTVVLGVGAVLVLGMLQRTLKLEQINVGLQRFVPRTVQKLIEDNPEHPMFDKAERNATVMFLDIERYTRMSEEISAEKLNQLVEKYFSVFLDLILSRGGEINETAGDGIMVIFSGGASDALNAVSAAVAIREQALVLNRARAPREPEILVNIGINTGTVLLGATAIRGATGEHLTYTASGTVTNLAARLCDLGEKGEICISSETARLVAGRFALSDPVPTPLKNFGEPVLVCKVE